MLTNCPGAVGVIVDGNILEYLGMLTKRIVLVLSALASSVSAYDSPQNQTAKHTAPQHAFFRVTVAASVPAPLQGRLLIFVKKGSGDKEVTTDPFHPNATWVAGAEVHDLAPGASIDVDADQSAYPQPFSTLPPGDYEAQAVLDTDHTYNYSGRSPK